MAGFDGIADGIKNIADIAEKVKNPKEAIGTIIKEKIAPLQETVAGTMDTIAKTQEQVSRLKEALSGDLFENLSKVFDGTLFTSLIASISDGSLWKSNVDKPSESGSSLINSFRTMIEKSKVAGGYDRLLRKGTVQGVKVACYNLAENFRYLHNGSNLFVTTPDIVNTKTNEEWIAKNKVDEMIKQGNLKAGDTIWLQGVINPSDKDSTLPGSKNHWVTYLGNGDFGDQNGVYNYTSDRNFWKNRYVTKVYSA